ncbi:phosphatidylserine decarboxylase [Phycisphaerales bacterium AB-hyl4]|uniref:Phosphatidylserine decarboxylase n=1 Tax=Natronomicrosphaera hydrolytica TaxID=3242702 RepID=A0ABV4U1T8_9BACT
MLSGYARNEWLTIIAVGLMISGVTFVVGWWWLSVLVVIATVALVLFFRDPHRRVPTQRGAVVAPADGRVSSVHRVEHFEPFDEPAVCIRIFLSVLDVHINRSPCHGEVVSITHKPGKHLNALNPDSAEVNESNLLVMVHPIRRQPVAAVRQVAGLLARTIVCAAEVGKVLQRGERIGIIKLGSTTELYLPESLGPEVQVQQGQKVLAGRTVVAMTASRETGTATVVPRASGESEPGDEASNQEASSLVEASDVEADQPRQEPSA